MPTLLQARPKSSVVIVDLDGVLVDVFRSMDYQLHKRGIEERVPVPTGWDFGGIEERWRNFAMDCLDDPHFYADMLPVVGAIPALHLLSRRYVVCAMTSRAAHFQGDPRKADLVVRATRNWLYRYEILPPDMVFSKHKLQKALDEYGRDSIAFVVEDHPGTACSFVEAGITAYLVDYPYNQNAPCEGHPNLYRVGGLADVVEHRRRIGDMDASPRLPSAESAQDGHAMDYDFYEQESGNDVGNDAGENDDEGDENGPGNSV